MIYELFLDARCLAIPCRFVAPSIPQSLDLAAPFLEAAFQSDMNRYITLCYDEHKGIEEFFSSNMEDLEEDLDRLSFLERCKEEKFIVYHDCIKEKAIAYINRAIEEIRRAF